MASNSLRPPEAMAGVNMTAGTGSALVRFCTSAGVSAVEHCSALQGMIHNGAGKQHVPVALKQPAQRSKGCRSLQTASLPLQLRDAHLGAKNGEAGEALHLQQDLLHAGQHNGCLRWAQRRLQPLSLHSMPC